jgi:hypothetical protein
MARPTTREQIRRLLLSAEGHTARLDVLRTLGPSADAALLDMLRDQEVDIERPQPLTNEPWVWLTTTGAAR